MKRRHRGALGYMGLALLGVAALLVPSYGLWRGGYEHLAWIAAWSLVTFSMYLFDKLAAARGKDASGSSKASRINESVLHVCALLGGFVGGWIGRHALRHKTRKREFAAVLVLATVLHTAMLAWLW